MSYCPVCLKIAGDRSWVGWQPSWDHATVCPLNLDQLIATQEEAEFAGWLALFALACVALLALWEHRP